MDELISLIVPIYNGEKYVEQFYEMCRMQTYSNIELIFIDDGSNDNTAHIIDQLAEKDERVVVYHKKNGGVSTARNLGIKKAQGKYIAFADIDDFIYPNYLQYLYQLVRVNDADIAFCSYIKMTDQEDYATEKHIQNAEVLLFDKQTAIKNFCARRYLTGYSYLKLIKTSIAKKAAFPEDIVYGEDFIFSYEVLKLSNKVVYGNEIQYIYVQYQASSTHIKRDNTMKYKMAWDRHLELLRDVNESFPIAYSGALVKCYLLAINNTTRVYDKTRDKEFLEEWYKFIRENAKKVTRDKENRKVVRGLGLLGGFNAKLVCVLCEFFFKIQEFAGVTFRRTM